MIVATLLCLDSLVVLMKNDLVNDEQLVLGLGWARWKRGVHLPLTTESRVVDEEPNIDLVEHDQ